VSSRSLTVPGLAVVQPSCRGGKPQPACYVASVDLSALPPDARARAEAALAGGRVLIRGRITVGSVPRFPSLGRLVATEAWLSATTGPGAGTVYRIVDNGVRCITTPCFSLRASALNTARRVALSDLDLAPVGAPRELVGRGYIRPGLGDAGYRVFGT